ncbi:MAG: PilZ domain-containing protein [Desulfatitalea sp.]|nr:PilZ domain-containing protein [Desulfatitalea sp.]MBI5896227.1 PilZ domain-containing protein [Desulfobacterales bacterium]
MVEKVFITSNNMATFVCPQCGNVTTANVSKYAATDKRITVKCNCSCGHRFSVALEKRRQYRKTADLPGMYFYRLPNGDMDKGIMRVVDVSSTGLKLRLNVPRNFEVGEMLRVEFHLDDKRRTFIEKRVIVRNVIQTLVGTSFAPNEGDDPNLGFYLMS